MRRIARATVPLLLLALLWVAPAKAEFGFQGVDVTFNESDGTPVSQAGSHPFEMTTTLDVNTVFDPGSGKDVPDGAFKDLTVSLPPGFVGTPTPTLRCSVSDFLNVVDALPACPNSTAVGVSRTRGGLRPGAGIFSSPVYNLEPSPGVAAKLGFIGIEIPVVIDVTVNPDPPHNVVARVTNIPQAALFHGSDLTLWGVPAAPAHDPLRGSCLDVLGKSPDEFVSRGNCPVNLPEKPFLTLPRACAGPLVTDFFAVAWNTRATDSISAVTHDNSEPPNPLGMTGCSKLPFAPRIASRPTTGRAESPTGLDFDLDIDDEGLTSPNGVANSDIKKTVVSLPEGVTLNPSVAEGLATCSPADYARERFDSEPGEGCPQASKVGTVEVETPLLEGTTLQGQVFVATQDDPATTEPGAENPFDSMIAIYIVIKDPKLGVVVKQAGKVEPGPRNGRLVSTFDEIPQFPFSHLHFHFREGGRSPLITPPRCGSYTTQALFAPWSDPDRELPTTASFEISSGVGGSACPPPGPPPFVPGFIAGSISNSAATYSPFYMRLTRRDGDQDMTRFSSLLPPGVLGKIAGVAQCPEAAVAAARARTGRQENAAPSCPPSSRIGRTLAGAGVGPQLTYVPGSLYLAGPYNGAPLSVVSVTPALAGPFDAGTVVVRVALKLNQRTAQVEIDGSASDPIPHILKGIVLKVRDLRVYADRPEFTLNPTSCDPSEVKANLFGSFADVFDPADDVPVSLASRYQAANCSRLRFKPKFSLRLRGGTERGDHPALTAVVRPRAKDANFSRAVVTLPPSAFLENAHIRTICTRVQYWAENCPKGAIYGRATAWSPLLDKPLKGPVYLRSSNNELPDLVVALHGIVDVDLVGRIDSHEGGIRTTFARVPDAPVSRFVLRMQGGKKGLIVNSRDLCRHASRATAHLTAQNARKRNLNPLVKPVDCTDGR